MHQTSRQQTFRYVACLLGAIISLLALGIAAPPASAGQTQELTVPKSGTLINDSNDPVNMWVASQDPAQLQNQQRLMDLRDWIRAQPGDFLGQFLDQVDDIKSGSATILWSGSLSDPILVAAETHAESIGIPVSVDLRPYTLTEIQDAEAALFASRPVLSTLGFTLDEVDGVQANEANLIAIGKISDSASVGAIQSAIGKIT